MIEQEAKEYAKYLARTVEIKRPKLPNYKLSAYTDNEYITNFWEIQNDFDAFDDSYLVEKHLKGE